MGNTTGESSLYLMSILLQDCLRKNSTKLTDQEQDPEETTSVPEEPDSGAVLYIVAVLVFYSLGIIVMIIKYSKTEQKEMEEELALDHFFKGMPCGKTAREHHVNTVAIKAFHTLTNSAKVSIHTRKEMPSKKLLETDV